MSASVIVCEQRSEEWRQARAGKVTASEISNVLAKGRTKNQEALTRANYRAQIIAEILTGRPAEDTLSTGPMRWGIANERYAKAAYEAQCDVLVDNVGFVIHPTIKRFGASPDGLVGDDGIVQFKCPNTATHLTCLLRGDIPAEHLPQIHTELACAGPQRVWCDFVSFDPRLPEDLQLFVKRLPRDEKAIEEIETEVERFNDEIDDVLLALSSRRDLEGQLRKSIEAVNSAKAAQSAKPTLKLVARASDKEPDIHLI